MFFLFLHSFFDRAMFALKTFFFVFRNARMFSIYIALDSFNVFFLNRNERTVEMCLCCSLLFICCYLRRSIDDCAMCEWLFIPHLSLDTKCAQCCVPIDRYVQQKNSFFVLNALSATAAKHTQSVSVIE